MDRDTWAGLYRKLTIAFNKPISGEQAGIMFEALQDLPNERMHEAITRTIRTSKHWPTVADLREQTQAVAVAEYRNSATGIEIVPMTDEQQAGILKAIREAKAKLGWA